MSDRSWLEGVIERLKRAQLVTDVDLIWERGVHPARNRTLSEYQIARWWVHWRMRQLVRAERRMMAARETLRTLPADQSTWPDAWWRPIPPEQVAADEQARARMHRRRASA